MNKWDVVLLSYPFTNLRGVKVRPALIVSPNNINQGSDALFMLITSNTDRRSEYEVSVVQSHPEFIGTGLLKDSVIRVGKLMMLEKSLVQCRIGALGPTLKTAVEKELRAFFEFPPFQPSLGSDEPTLAA